MNLCASNPLLVQDVLFASGMLASALIGLAAMKAASIFLVRGPLLWPGGHLNNRRRFAEGACVVIGAAAFGVAACVILTSLEPWMCAAQVRAMVP